MTPDLEALLAGSGQVRKLARNLVADATLADDLEQDAWLAALQGRPADGVPRLSWMGAVLRNLLRQERRSAGRRRRREERAARPESTPPPGEALERLEAHRAVVDAVAALHEPYRTAIVRRYFDGLSPRQIAARSGSPVRTVHTQLARGLTLLRERLGRDHGPGLSAWLPALLSLGGAPGGFLGTATGALLMDAKVKLLTGAVALVGLFVVTAPLWRAAEPAVAVEAAAVNAPVELVRPAADPLPTVEEPLEPEGARVAATPLETPTEPAPSAAATGEIHGRVLDIDGGALAGLPVRLRSRAGALGDTVLSNGDGTFVLRAGEPEGLIECTDERWTSVLEPMIWDHGFSDNVHVLVVAPSLALAGTVVDAAGQPIPGAQVVVSVPWGLRSRFPVVMDGSRVRSWQTTADVSGHFELDAALVSEAFLRASFHGYENDIRPLPPGSTYDLRLVLNEPGDGSDYLRGTVVDDAGFAVEGARVALGFNHTRSAVDGSFAIPITDQPSRGVLGALKQGHLPAFLERLGDSNLAPDAWPDTIVLQLGGPPLALAGRVLDASGDPLSGIEVRLVDETSFGPVEIEGKPRVTRAGYVEPMLRGAQQAGATRTDDDGRFRIEGLLDRDYTLGLFEPQTMVYAEEGSLAAGREHLTLHLPEDLIHPLVAGRLVTLSGEPIAGAAVMPLVKAFSADPDNLVKPVYGHPAHTDANGAFAFTDIAASVASFGVSGPEIGFGHTFAIPEGADLEQLEFKVPLRCHLQVDLQGSALEARRFSLLDDGEQVVSLSAFYGDYAYSMDHSPLTDGRSEVLSASETARTLVLYDSSGEVLRVPIELTPGELNTLTP